MTWKQVMRMKKGIGKIRTVIAVIFLSAVGFVLSSCGGVANPIPQGGTYTVASTGEVFEAGEAFPEDPQVGDIFYDYEAGYEYAYASEVQIDRVLTEDDGYFTHYFIPQEELTGWCVAVKDRQQESYGELRSEICGMPVLTLDFCFFGCENMIEAPVIPNTVTSMEAAFSWCHSLEKMPQLPEGIVNMGNAFEQCSSITKISSIPTTVKDLSFAFAECKALTEVGDIPDGVENMQGAFNQCIALKTVGIIPESVKDLSYTFAGCVSLEGDIYIYANPELYDGCFLGTEKQIFVYGNDHSDWMILAELCKTVKSGWFDNVVMPG